jgi:hypothetical protein
MASSIGVSPYILKEYLSSCDDMTEKPLIMLFPAFWQRILSLKGAASEVSG